MHTRCEISSNTLACCGQAKSSAKHGPARTVLALKEPERLQEQIEKEKIKYIAHIEDLPVGSEIVLAAICLGRRVFPWRLPISCFLHHANMTFFRLQKGRSA
jgi:hypothetical protein